MRDGGAAHAPPSALVPLLPSSPLAPHAPPDPLVWHAPRRGCKGAGAQPAAARLNCVGLLRLSAARGPSRTSTAGRVGERAGWQRAEAGVPPGMPWAGRIESPFSASWAYPAKGTVKHGERFTGARARFQAGGWRARAPERAHAVSRRLSPWPAVTTAIFFEAHARGLRPDRGSGCGPRSADEGDVRILGREERADGGNPVIHQACTHSVSCFSLRHAPHGRRPRRAGWVARPERGRARRASLQETLAAMVQCRLPGLNVPLTSPPPEPFK